MRTAQKHTLRNKENLIAYLFLLPSLAGVCIFVLLPFLDSVRRSFFEAMSGKFVGLANYHLILHNESFLKAAENTVKFIGICVPLLLTVSLLLAVMLQSLKGNQGGLKALFLVPISIPVASVVLLWRILFHEKGLLNALLLSVFQVQYDFMNSGKAMGVLVFTYIWKNAGYDMVLWLAGLSSIPRELYEAAQMDGAGAFEKLWYITLPLLVPTVFITTVLSVVNSFKVFREAYLIAGNYPHESIYMLQHIFNNWFSKLDIQKMCAGAVLMAGAVILFLVIMNQIFNGYETDSGRNQKKGGKRK